MAVSVLLEPLLEKELELAAKRQGVTKSQFIISALEKALGHKDPYQLLLSIKAEEANAMEKDAFDDDGYKGDLTDSNAMREFIRAKLSRKHGISTP